MPKEFTNIIDPHVHLFDLLQGEYLWLKSQNPPFWHDKQKINHNFDETDLTLPAPLKLSGFVHIEAGFDNNKPWRELDWLEQTCTRPFKSVAFADLTHRDFSQHLQQLSQRTTCVGVRHILDDEAAAILSTTQVPKNFALLAKHNLSFDAQFNVGDSVAVNALLACTIDCPELKIIINHAGWPSINKTEPAHALWLENLHKLADNPNISIKLSGWEMLNHTWPDKFMYRVLLDCLLVFGRDRVMLASNFPVSQLSLSYSDLWLKYRQLADIIDADCLHRLCYANAYQWYGFTF